jgi:hypothetical protein
MFIGPRLQSENNSNFRFTGPLGFTAESAEEAEIPGLLACLLQAASSTERFLGAAQYPAVTDLVVTNDQTVSHGACYFGS